MEGIDQDVMAATDTYVLDQLDFVIGCEWEDKCYHLAEWIRVFLCCQHSWNVCQKHHEDADELAMEGDPNHLPCDGSMENMTWLRM